MIQRLSACSKCTRHQWAGEAY